MSNIIQPDSFKRYAEQKAADEERQKQIDEIWDLLTNVNNRNLPFLEENIQRHTRLLTALGLPLRPVPSFIEFPQKLNGLQLTLEARRNGFTLAPIPRLPTGYYRAYGGPWFPRQLNGDLVVGLEFVSGIDGEHFDNDKATPGIHPVLVSQFRPLKELKPIEEYKLEDVQHNWHQTHNLDPQQ